MTGQHHMRRQLAATVLSLLLAGCGANYTTAYRTFEPVEGGPNTALIDAKQRALFATPGPTGSDGKETYRKTLICAEPSPDALSAISSSLSASFGGLFPSGQQIQAALAAALSETAGQLGVRNATIQLLRDGMYRQCEAYMNGLIGRDYYEQIANKYVNAMVALLAIEQLAPVNAETRSIRASDNAKVEASTNVSVSAAPAQDAAAPKGNTEKNGNDQKSADGQAAADGQKTAEPKKVEDEQQGSGSSEGKASAAPPVVGVNVPTGSQREIPDHVSRAVNTMVTWFLTKDTVDYCLRGLFQGKTADGSALNEKFLDVCGQVILAQMSQQRTLTENLSGVDYALATQQANITFKAVVSNADKIVRFVTGIDGKIIVAKLNELVGKATRAGPSLKARLLAFTDPEALRGFLRQEVSSTIIDQMSAGLP